MTLTIRLVGRDDIPAVAELVDEMERYYGGAETRPLAEREAQVAGALFGSPPMAGALVAVDDSDGGAEAGAVAGIAIHTYLWPAAGFSHLLYLTDLYVRRSWRRRGVGTRLVGRLRALAVARPGCSRIDWTTDRDNPDARAFYKSLGFTESDGKVFYRLPTPTEGP